MVLVCGARSLSLVRMALVRQGAVLGEEERQRLQHEMLTLANNLAEVSARPPSLPFRSLPSSCNAQKTLGRSS
eukprot:1599734-Rhodomonas_salina.1